jgi:hypothetical protein
METTNSPLRPLRVKSGGPEIPHHRGLAKPRPLLYGMDLDPVNRFNQPGLRPKDLYHGHVVYDIVSSPPKTDKDHKKFMADWINLLCGSVDAASHSPQRICIVTNASNPPLPLQSVFFFFFFGQHFITRLYIIHVSRTYGKAYK